MTEEIYNYIEETYGGLINKIAHTISGDNATASVDDNIQDLYLSVYDAVSGFEKQGTNGTLEEFYTSRGFDKYLKTTLWCKKASKGKGITTKMGVQGKKCASMTDVSAIVTSMVNDHTDFDVVDFWDQVSSISLSEAELNILNIILKDPVSCISEKGGIKISPIMRKLNMGREATEYSINSLGEKVLRKIQYVD